MILEIGGIIFDKSTSFSWTPTLEEPILFPERISTSPRSNAGMPNKSNTSIGNLVGFIETISFIFVNSLSIPGQLSGASVW